jgi:hypothetical protein
MLNCPGCGLTNRPYDLACSLCRTILQDRGAAEEKRHEWDALSPRLREEQERVFDRMRGATEQYLRWLRSHRRSHAILGALLVFVPMNMAVFFSIRWSFPADLLLGAAAGLLLNRYRGGAWHGAGLFLAAAILSILFRLLFITNKEFYFEILWLMTALAICCVTGFGYYMGLKLAMEHVDHTTTG